MTIVPAATAAARVSLSGLLAADASGSAAGPLVSLGQHILAVVIYAAIGIIVFGLGIFLFVKLCPFSVRKEIEEDQNTSLGIIMGAVLLGLAWIIAAAIQG